MTTSAMDESTVPSRATVFAGLVPTKYEIEDPGTGRAGRLAAKGMFATLPVLLAGSMAITGATAPVAPAAADERPTVGGKQPKRAVATLRAALASAGSAVATSATPAALRPAAVPSTYRVQDGDTVSDIAGRFGLSTASVLAANGLGWKSVIFPGQELRLGTTTPSSAPHAARTKPGSYTIVAGDTITRIAARHGLSAGTLLAANNLRWTSIIYPGQTIVLPGRPVLTSSAGEPTSSPVATPAPALSSSYVIREGDTISAIAARFGVSVGRLLEANGLSRSSTIFVGRTLEIPSIDTAVAGAGVTPLSDEMRVNARLIVAVGTQLGVPEYGIVIALATAMQESSLRNINHGDRDSVGIFQQRPSIGWGAAEDLLNVSYAARLFFGGPSNPNRGVTRGLLDVPGWQSMSLTEAAQAVQVSAHPDAYGKWEQSARAWLAQLS